MMGRGESATVPGGTWLDANEKRCDSGSWAIRGRAAKSAELETPCGHGLPRYVKEMSALEDTYVTKRVVLMAFRALEKRRVFASSGSHLAR
jgi:hypothetical protein